MSAARGDAAFVESRRPLLLPSFLPAARYLMTGESSVAHGYRLVCVLESDVGPMQTYADDYGLGRWLRVARTWAPGKGRLMRNSLRHGMNVIEIGANIGYFTALAARAVGSSGHVLAVEADPKTFSLLRTNVEMNHFDNVELLPVAAHRYAGLITSTRDPGNDVDDPAYVGSEARQATPLQAVRLDDVLDPDVPIHFVTVDVGGMGHAAIEGLARTIQNWRPRILVEFNPQKIGWFGDDPHAVLALYRELGLEIGVLGWDALRLRNETDMDIDELILDGFAFSSDADAEITERTRQIGLVNLVLKSK